MIGTAMADSGTDSEYQLSRRLAIPWARDISRTRPMRPGGCGEIRESGRGDPVQFGLEHGFQHLEIPSLAATVSAEAFAIVMHSILHGLVRPMKIHGRWHLDTGKYRRGAG